MKKALLTVGGLALVVTISACGARPENGQAPPAGSVTQYGNAQELVRAASAKNDQAKWTKFTCTSSFGGNTFSAHGEGRFGADAAVDVTVNTNGHEVEVRFVNQTMYLKLPPEASAMIGGKLWGRIPTGDKTAKGAGGIKDVVDQNDPSRFLDQVQQAGTITKSEQTTLDGQPVSHYQVDLDYAKVAAPLAESSGLSDEELQKLTDQVKAITIELWLNQDSLPVQITEDLTPVQKAVGAPDTGKSANITMKYSDWGIPVDIQAPPADQVGDLPPVPK